jgi:flagellar biosynthesis GTPase FlhF
MGIDKSIEDPWGDEESEKEVTEREKLEQERLENERSEQERLEQERLERERLEQERLEQERLERERLEKERFKQLKIEAKVYPNNSLFVIPSWSDLLGYPTLGTYVNHPVSKIETDIVIFFSGYDYSIETQKGTLHYLFGLGYHYLKFELESGKYITDYRLLTGLILPDFVYDHMATSSNITLEDDPYVIIAENVIKVPIDLSDKSEEHLTFIKGALMRNVFIPYKEIFLEMMGQISKENSYDISAEGHKILSAHWDFYNQILVSDKLGTMRDSSYLNQTAGLDRIGIEADKLLQDTISPINLSIIDDNIKTLKNIYSNLEFDPMYLFSVIEQAALMFSSVSPPVSSKPIILTTNKSSKKSIFTSAEERIDAFISWPVQFKRKAKKEPVKLPKLVEPLTSWDQTKPQLSDISTPEIREIEQEAFEIDRLKSESVELKPLPPSPKPDIKQILRYLKSVIEENYEMRSIGQAFEIARESARKMGVSATTIHQAKIWEMSKFANIYIKKEPRFGLPEKEKTDLIRKIDKWLFEIEENERLERERLEKIRLEKERLERLERERIEKERIEMERKERERLEQIRLEKERIAQEQLEQERLERIEKEREEALRLERERLEKVEEEKRKALRLEQERIEREKQELEAIEKEKQEIKRLKKERKQKEKEAKREAKKQKQLEKQKKKLEKKKLKEQEKLKNV